MSDKSLIVQDIMQRLIGENDSAYIKNEKIRLDFIISKFVLLLQDNPLEMAKERIKRNLNLSIDRQKELNHGSAL